MATLKERLTIELTRDKRRYLKTHPYTLLVGEENAVILNEILGQMMSKNSPEDMSVMSFLEDNSILDIPHEYYEYDHPVPIDALQRIINQRQSFVLEHGIKSIIDESLRYDEAILPFIFVIFDERTDPQMIHTLIKESRGLCIFFINMVSEDVARHIDPKILMPYEGMLLTKRENDVVVVQIVEYLYELHFER